MCQWSPIGDACWYITRPFSYEQRTNDQYGSGTTWTIYYIYDTAGSVIGFEHNGTKYWYDKNLQGDIVGIRNASGTLVAQYEYDAWGKHIRITDGSGNDVSDNPNHIANINPFRYRGYYFDVETGWYYLNARYYDPNVGRFISPDAILGANGGLQGYNLFAYCNNNPVMYIDPNGFASMSIYTDFLDSMRPLMQLRHSGAGMAIGILFAAGLLITAKPYSGNSYVDDPIIPKPRYPFKQAAKEEEAEKEKDITVPVQPKKQAYFTVNPYAFKPNGLIMKEYPGSVNGRIIEWRDPVSKAKIFEWNEDLKYGSHYHVMMIEWNGKHHGMHYFPGAAVPEPWNSMYFGV